MLNIFKEQYKGKCEEIRYKQFAKSFRINGNKTACCGDLKTISKL